MNITAVAAMAACAITFCLRCEARSASADATADGQGRLRIVKALYGDFSTPVVRPLCRDVSGIVGRGGEIFVSNEAMGGDPCLGRKKELEVVYMDKGVRRISRTPEHASFRLPRGATVASAWYGVVDPLWRQPSPQAIDVTAKLAAMAKPDGTIECGRLDSKFAGGDPAYMVVKETRITYVLDGVSHTASIPEGGSFKLP